MMNDGTIIPTFGEETIKNINEANPHSPTNDGSGHKKEGIKMLSNKINAVSYGRTATATGVSLKRQEEQVEMVCKTKGYELIGTYFDEGISGRSTDRPALNKLKTDMKDKKFSKIIVYDAGRISRNLVEFINFVNEAEEHGCDVELVIGEIDSGIKALINDETTRKVMRALTEYESREHSSKIKAGLAVARAKRVDRLERKLNNNE